MDPDLKAFIAGMPKAELHIHLEGALEPSLVRTFAERNQMPVPPSAATETERTSDSGWEFHDLTSFLAVYYPNMAVLQTEEDFCDLAWSYLCKAHGQNVVHAEMFFDPQAHTSRGVPFSTVIRGYRSAVLRAERELSLSASLILCILRDHSAESAMDTLLAALPYRSWIVGLGLDSDERDNPPRKFADVFARARQEGFRLTMHCDVDQEDSVEHIRQALLEVGVDRIDHGTNVVEDEGLVALLRDKGVGLTCCPVSNSVVSKDFKGKEIMRLLRAGVKVTVNSDDPAYFRAYLAENLELMATAAAADGSGLSRDELVQLQRNAFEIAWVEREKRDGFLDVLEDFVAKDKDKHALGSL